MRDLFLRVLRLTSGLFLFALGIVITMNANIGYAPWDVFHVGLAKTTGISIGNISIIIGIMIVIISVLLGEKLGLGTVINMIFIGVFLDFILNLNIIPIANHFLIGILMLIIGLLIMAFASYLYMGSALGVGPRDSLMVALTRKTGLPIGFCRGTIETLAVFIGWLLGGMVGIGTVLAALIIGPFVQMTFKILNFDAIKIQHESLIFTYKSYFGKDK
ncbi:MAG: hypothetical protein JXC36_00380 [Candidatus Atribacteria bacterium]|nr:hypothetical protein [Candidatus Atribacteria bacterium]